MAVAKIAQQSVSDLESLESKFVVEQGRHVELDSTKRKEEEECVIFSNKIISFS